MKMEEIRRIAKAMGLKAGNLNKLELVRAIQRAEGNFPCYATRGHECDQINCLWREDCMKAIRA